MTFDEPNLVANAGLLLVATLVARLDLERLINATVRLGGRVGGALPGRKVLTLVHAMVAGASHIDHADVLRSGATSSVLGHRVMAPSTLGTFLRAFTFGHVRQLDAVLAEALRRAWSLGAGPGCSADGHRSGLDHLRGVRQGQGRGWLWLHPRARLSPPHRHALGHRRGAPCPPAPRRSQHLSRHGALRRGARRPGAPGRGDRRTHHALRLGLLVQPHHRHPRAPRGRLHHGRADAKVRGQRHLGHRRVGLDPDRIHL